MKHRLAGCASMIRRSDVSSLPTANTPLTAFGCEVKSTMDSPSNNDTALTYSERRPPTRGRFNGLTSFKYWTTAAGRNRSDEAASVYVAAMAGGRTSSMGTLTKFLGNDNRLATIGTIVVVAEEYDDVDGMGVVSSGQPACLRKSNGPQLVDESCGDDDGVAVGDDNASITNLGISAAPNGMLEDERTVLKKDAQYSYKV
jgi:hypothetical protein